MFLNAINKLNSLRHCVLFCLFFLIRFPHLYAQEDLFKSFEQLQSDFLIEKTVSEEYIDARNKLAIDFKSVHLDTLIGFHKSTIELSRKLKRREPEIDALRIMGLLYDSRRDYEMAYSFFQMALNLSESNHSEKQKSQILNNLGGLELYKGNYTSAFSRYYDALAISRKLKDKPMESIIYNNLANVFYFRKDYSNAIVYYKKALEIDRVLNDSIGIMVGLNNLGELYLAKKEYGLAVENLLLSNELSKVYKNKEAEISTLVSLGQLYYEKGNYAVSDSFFSTAIEYSSFQGDPLFLAKAKLGLSELKKKSGFYSTSIKLAKEAIDLASQIGQKELISLGYALLAENYALQNQGLLAYKSHKLFKIYADSLLNLESERKSAALRLDYEKAQAEAKFKQATLQQRWIIFLAILGLIAVAIIALLVNKNRAKAKRSNEELNQKNKYIEDQNEALEKTLKNLKATQSQLIQSEKMASLGEMTAGIAHEIQNPLNFIKNLSEVNKELLEELVLEMQKPQGSRDEMAISDCIKDLTQNMEIVNIHGSRADGIIKSMLYHSRKSGTSKESIDINQLCNDYLKLSYQSMRATPKPIEVKIQTDWDPEAGKISLIPQDIGRVILNLCQNAFYAMALRDPGVENALPNRLRMATKASKDYVTIEVEDNGPGISAEVLSKIFQPFFTTKPTGEGTGLGLSISYDIITKGHGGQFQVHSEEGKLTRFTIILPIV